MHRSALLILSVTLICLGIHADEPVPALDGVITAIPSPTEFNLEGKHVVISDQAEIDVRTGDRTFPANAAQRDLYLGGHLQVFGSTKSNTLHATRIILLPSEPTVVAARGIVEAVPPAASSALAGTAATLRFRAAGYPVVVPAKAAVTYLPPLSAASPVHTNQWVAFHGTLQPNGTVLADKVVCAENTLSKSQKKLSEKTEYDPAIVDPDFQQTSLSKVFLGIDPRKIPPYEDHQMQARITAVGLKLIPACQRNLSDTDPTRINFRFQLVDESHWSMPLTLGSGIILVPFQLIDRLQNDSQVAAILAESMAKALEKQAVDTQVQLSNVLIVGGVETAVVLLPGAGAGALAVGIPLTVSAAKQEHLMQEERVRVSLYLLHDAGFDINEAPKAWWLLNGKKKNLEQIKLPHRSAYLYQVLGTTWRKPEEPDASSAPSSAPLTPAAPSPPVPSTQSTPSAAHAASPPRSSAGSSG